MPPFPLPSTEVSGGPLDLDPPRNLLHVHIMPDFMLHTHAIQISVGQNFYHRLAASAGMLVNKAHMYFLFLSWTLALVV